METKHTPGPWEVVSTVAHPFAVHSDGKQLAVAQSAMNSIQGPERAANARLIAAAPELLDICESILAEVDYEGLQLESGRIAKLRAAIAKATK